MDGNGGGVEMAVVEERNEKKHKKHKKRHHKSRDAPELIVELEDIGNRSDKHADQAEQAEKQQEGSTVAAAPTAVQQLPVEPIIASAPPPSSKPKQDKEKGRTRDQLKNSTMIVEEMAEGESFLRDYASDEVLLHIFSYMDPRTLGRCSQVCKRWHTVTEDRLLWIRHNRKEWLKSKDQSGAAAGKAFFLQRMNSFRRKKKAAEANRRRILEDAQARERRRRHGVFHALSLHSTFIDAIVAICFVMFIAFVSIKLDKIVLWPWHIVGIPLFIFLGLFAIRFVHIIFFAAEMEAADPSSDAYSLATKFFVRLMDGNTSLVDVIVMGLQILCLLAFVVLLFLKLDRVLDITLAEVFAPVWIGYAISLGFIFGDFAQGDYLIGIMTGLLPYMLYFVLIALKYDSVISPNWAVVHSPIWAGVPLWLIGMWVWMIFIDEFSNAAEGLFYIGLFSYLIVGLPVFLVFQIIMVVKLDKGPLWHSSWRALFSPLFIFFGIVACVALSWAACISTAIIDLIC